ncbi:MAG TPA: OmpA family protein [Candidatus Kapabacteria bacterium]|nr:OmpA family protein [Candidatus Kapabacteria bacterium]
MPPPECKPGKSTAKGIDTSKIQPGNYRYHIDLLPAPINSNGNDNALSFLPDLVSTFSGERASDGSENGKNAKGSVTTQRLFSARLLPDLHFDELHELTSGQPFEHIGAATYCAADNRIYFTVKAPNDDPNDYDLYSARVIQKSREVRIEDVAPLTSLNKSINFDGQPAVSKDGLIVVFASDRAGGYGGVDLWYSSRTSISSPWQEPKNMGPVICSPCDEISPSFSSDGKKLYFASNGHETIGGYDLFSVGIEHDSKGGAQNLGEPINTTSDEIFPYELSDSQFFYASNQPAEFSGRNLFVMRRTKLYDLHGIDVTEVTPADTIQLKGKVDLPKNSDQLPEVFVRDVARDTEIARKQTDTAGNYSFDLEKGRQYDIGAEVKDKFYDVHRVDLRKPKDSIITIQPLSVPDTLTLRINFPFDDDSHPYDFVIDESGNKTDTKWQTSMDLLARSIKNSSASLEKVILYGHTDSLGTDEYNNALSQRRASFVAKQLQARGIPARLFTIVPKGRTMPLARAAGESDDTFYLRCRRVEFIKVFKKEKVR